MSKKSNRRNFIRNTGKLLALIPLFGKLVNVDSLFAVMDAEGFVVAESNNPRVIKISDYPSLGKIGGYEMISSKVIVIRTSESKFVALNITCTHKKCDVEFDGTKFECPCHGSEFSKTGKVLNGPAKKNLISYRTEYNSEDNTLTVNL
ncbi:MAG: ubiquinol-cytochrome c reductase iron-sulfur subunit [Ignavibacteria bacterium]